MPEHSLRAQVLGHEILLHDPRVAILHPEGFTDEANTVRSYLDQKHWWDRDPEWVLIHTKLMDHHFLDDHFRNERYPHTAVEVIDWAHENPWLDVYFRAATYATHVLVLNDGRHPPLKEFLYSPKRPKRPTRVILV